MAKRRKDDQREALKPDSPDGDTRAPLLRRTGSTYLGRLEGPRRACELPPADQTGFPADVVRFASRMWTLKAEEEFRSAAVFTEIVGGLTEAGAPLDLLAALADVVRDEIDHAALCRDLAERFEAPLPRAAMASALPRLRAHSQRPLRALALLLFEGAVGETLSAMLFHASKQSASEPSTRAALAIILRDEARHARLSWHGLRALLPDASGADRTALQEDLRLSLGALERGTILPVLKRLEAGIETEPEAYALGVIPPEVRVDTFYKGLERVVWPRLAELGFDGELAWEQRYQ